MHVVTSYEEALALDAEALAKTSGLSFEDALEALQNEEALGLVVADLRRDYPNLFSAASIDPGSEWRALVRFKRPVPEGAVKKMAALESNVVLLDDGKYSEKEMEAAADELKAALLAMGSGEVITTYWEGGIEGFATPPPGYEGLSSAQLQSLLRVKFQGPDYYLRFSEGPLAGEDDAFAGDFMLRNNSRPVRADLQSLTATSPAS